MRSITNNTKSQIARIIELLRNEGQMHIRGISRSLESHPMKISRIIDGYLSPFLEITEINEFGLKAKLIKLKEDRYNITIEDILRYKEARRRIRSKTIKSTK